MMMHGLLNRESVIEMQCCWFHASTPFLAPYSIHSGIHNSVRWQSFLLLLPLLGLARS
jgi:hypothetical protein